MLKEVLKLSCFFAFKNNKETAVAILKMFFNDIFLHLYQMYLKLIFPATSFSFLGNHLDGEGMCTMAEELRSCGLKFCQMIIELGRERGGLVF